MCVKAKCLLADALALQEAGCFSIVLEAVPHSVASFITSRLRVPTIGIGSGPGTSGQVLVMMDILGIFDKFSPKFSHTYAHVGDQAVDGLRQYINDVRSRSFPINGKHTYKMNEGEEERLAQWISETESAKT